MTAADATNEADTTNDSVPTVAVTGTPGTGKTSALTQIAAQTDLSVIHLNEVIQNQELYTERDTDRDSLVADLEAVRTHLGEWDGILESHLAHHFSADRVVVLRCEPNELVSRLEERGEPLPTARENAESEALDVVLSEAIEEHGSDAVYEIDTTDSDPATVADEILAVRRGDREPTAGTVDYTEYLVS